MVFHDDEANLGGLSESQIQNAFRVNGSVVTPLPVVVDTVANTITVVTPGFSEWYFGENNASVPDWISIRE